MGSIKEAIPTPLIDLGNYPVIFSTSIARVDRLPNGLVGLWLVEDRMNCDGTMERYVVARVIRPAHSVIMASRFIANTMKNGYKDATSLVITEGPLAVQ